MEVAWFLLIVIASCMGFYVGHRRRSTPSKLLQNDLHNDDTSDNVASAQSSLSFIKTLYRRHSAVITNLANSQAYLRKKGAAHIEFLNTFRNELAELRDINQSIKASLHKVKIDGFDAQDKECLTQSSACSLGEIFLELKDNLNAFAKRHQGSILWPEMDDIRLNMPRQFVLQMFRELVINALMHNPPKTKVYIDCSVLNDACFIKIIDDGKGIANKLLEQINAQSAERYPRGRRYTDTVHYLDLVAILSVLNKLNAKLEIHSAIGFGTRLHLHLPIIRETEIKSTKVKLSDLQAINYADLLFFLPGKISSTSLSSYLKRRYRMTIVSSMEEVTTIGVHYQPRIILCDIDANFDAMNEFLGWLRCAPGADDTMVLCLCHLLPTAVKLQLLTNGVHQIVEKPITNQEVELLIDKLMQNQRQAQLKIAEAIAEYTVFQEEEIHSPLDDFTERFQTCIEANYSDPTFNIEMCSSELFVSSKTLQREN